MPSQVDGNHVLYHYLQKELQHGDYWLFQMMVARLVASLAIWFAPETYRAMPVLLPFAVRDPDARGNKAKGVPDLWGSTNSGGYFRDDNSLLKALPRPPTIESPSPIYDGRSIGKGFVASHVWREVAQRSGGVALASRDARTDSFVPNVVWLPKQVSKLTDREGSFAQQYLQAISLSLYRRTRFEGALGSYVEDAWSLLAHPMIPELGVPPFESLSFFHHDAGFIDRRKVTLKTVVFALGAAEDGSEIPKRVVSSRYAEGIRLLSRDTRLHLADRLGDYLETL